MQRMSEPQIVEAFVLTTTWPWPGFGMGNSFSSTVLLPGRIAPRIFLSMSFLLQSSL